jgi:hypothetical protein
MVNGRMEREGKTIKIMIGMYCRGFHHRDYLCSECRSLEVYALERLAKCPFQEGKTVCSLCSIHCYKTEMREKIRKIMRYSGPRMILRHPYLAIVHLIDKRRKVPVKPA